MLELIISSLVAVGFSIFGLWLYRRGIKDGLALRDNKPIEPIKTPVQVVRERIQAQETKKETDKMMMGLQNLLSYTGDPQKPDDEE